jgi:hypothetical protein
MYRIHVRGADAVPKRTEACNVNAEIEHDVSARYQFRAILDSRVRQPVHIRMQGRAGYSEQRRIADLDS